MPPLGADLVKWSIEKYHGKAILIGSSRWIEETLDQVGYMWPPWLDMQRKQHEFVWIPYVNFMHGVVLTGDLNYDAMKLCGWMGRRMLFVIEQHTWNKHAPDQPRYYDILEGLKCGSAVDFWWV